MAPSSCCALQAREAAEVLSGLSDGLLLLAAAADCEASPQTGQRRSRALEHEECVAWLSDSHLSAPSFRANTSHKRRKCIGSSSACNTPPIAQPSLCRAVSSQWLARQYTWKFPAPRLDLHIQESCQETQPQQSEVSLGMWQHVAAQEEDEVASGSSGSAPTAIDLLASNSDEEDVSSFTIRTDERDSFAFPVLAPVPVLLWGR